MRLLHALLTGLLALALAGCQSLSVGGGSGSQHLKRILASGELRAGLSGDQAPLNMHTKSGELIGLDVDLVRALAQSMGLTPRFVEMPFARLLPALERGEVDLVISGMTITPARNARVAFVGPYFISGKSLLTKSEKIANPERTAALDVPENMVRGWEASPVGAPLCRPGRPIRSPVFVRSAPAP